MKRFGILFIALGLAGCQSFTAPLGNNTVNVRGHISVNNRSTHHIQVWAYGNAVGPIISAKGIISFPVTVSVPYQDCSNDYCPDPNDQIVSLPLTIHDFDVNDNTANTSCQAGGKVLTSIEYVPTSYNPPGYVNCQ